MRSRRAGSVLAATALVLGLAACTPDGATPPAPTPSSSEPIKVTLAVYGPDAVISAYTKIASMFSSANPGVTVDIKPYTSHRLAMKALARTKGTSAAPDVFLASQRDLPRLMATKTNQGVNAMLSSQNVDFGDGYERAALEAFSADSALQCMPVDISPLVVYYNRDLIDLSTLRERGRQPTPESGWGFSDFVAAARQAASGPKRGVYVAPTVAQLAPFIYSAGNQLVDSTTDPTELTFADDTDTFDTVLGLLRDPNVTFTAGQLARKSALSRFKQGQLGMILGYRQLTPQLRQQDGLDFGVMPIPRIGGSATVTKATGLCVKPDLPHRTSTARFLAYLVSDAASRVLAATGYVVPANTAVLSSDAFEAPRQRPVGASVFADQIRFSQELPDTERWRSAQSLIGTALSGLLYDTSIGPLEGRLTEIDSAVNQVLSPSPSASPSTGTTGASPSASGSGSPSTTGSGSPSGSPSATASGSAGG